MEIIKAWHPVGSDFIVTISFSKYNGTSWSPATNTHTHKHTQTMVNFTLPKQQRLNATWVQHTFVTFSLGATKLIMPQFLQLKLQFIQNEITVSKGHLFCYLAHLKAMSFIHMYCCPWHSSVGVLLLVLTITSISSNLIWWHLSTGIIMSLIFHSSRIWILNDWLRLCTFKVLLIFTQIKHLKHVVTNRNISRIS